MRLNMIENRELALKVRKSLRKCIKRNTFSEVVNQNGVNIDLEKAAIGDTQTFSAPKSLLLSKLLKKQYLLNLSLET